MNDTKLSVVVLISGNGSNLQSIIDAQNSGMNFEVRAVISNRSNAYGLERARQAGIDALFIDPKQHTDRDIFDAELIKAIDQYQPDLVALAGFMRILSTPFVEHYMGRLLNIHPSLLPKYRGLHTHARALASGDKYAGCTIHFVIPELDAGPIIHQTKVKIEPNDTPESLASRVLKEEHRIYPMVIDWFAQGRLKLVEHRVVILDDQPVSN